MLPSPNRLRLDKDIKALFAKGKGVFDVWVGFKFRKNDRLDPLAEKINRVLDKLPKT